MATVKPEDIRNLAIIGHGNSGKTTLAETFLAVSGAISRPGRVEDGTTHTDYDLEEIARKISINTVPATFEWKGKEFNCLDTPGFVDFHAEVRVVLSAVDAFILIVDGVNGAEAGTEKTFVAARQRELPGVVLINKMDKDNADYDKAIASLKKELDGSLAPFVVPNGVGASFTGVVDVVNRKAYQWNTKDLTFKEVPVDGAMAKKIDTYREALVEAAAESDDALAEKYLGGEAISDDEMKASLRKGIQAGKLFPVLAGSGLGQIGAQTLLDLCAEYLPSPLERKFAATKAGAPVQVATKDAAFCGQIFKSLSEPHLGELACIRVISGSIKAADVVSNSTKETAEKIGQMFKMRGKERVEVPTLAAGEIGTLVKLKGTKTGDTLCSEHANIVMPALTYPDPLISIAVKPVTKADQEKLSTALGKLVEEDPAVRVRFDPATRQTLIEGNGEVQLGILIKRLAERFKVQVEQFKPKIAYKETVRGKAEAQGRHKKQTGGRGQFGDVWLRFEPSEPGKGFEFEDAVVGGVVPFRFIPAVEKGLREAVERGPLAGYPVTDLKIALYDGSSHAVDSSEIAFKLAAHIAFKEGMPKARPVLLEPIMDVEVVIPEAYMGDIMGDLNSRRAKIQGMEPVGRKQRIKAQAPLSEMDKYIVSLRSMTMGRGEYTMKFSHYEEVPRQQTDAIIAEAKKEKEQDQEPAE